MGRIGFFCVGGVLFGNGGCPLGLCDKSRIVRAVTCL